MAISKRLRFEILRRDGHACKYCGEKAPAVKITVDHVVPKALGGTDESTNLVAACGPCNSGKSSNNPDAPLVEGVKADAMRWQMAWHAAVAQAEHDGKQREKDIAKVRRNYTAAYKGRHGEPPFLPEGWQASVGRWLDLGLPMAMIDQAISATVGRASVQREDRWSYLAGCCWGKLRDLASQAKALANNGDPRGDIDESTLVERITAEFEHAWSDPHSRPDAKQLRTLRAHALAANAAGYEEISIAAAANSAARECVPDLDSFLSTVDSVFLRESEGGEHPFGKLGIDEDLLPTRKDRDVEAVAEAAVAVWRAAWRDAIERDGGPPAPERRSGAYEGFRASAMDTYREYEDADEVLLGAEWAGAQCSDDLALGIRQATAHRVTEPAVSAWGIAWARVTGGRPSNDVEEQFWRDCYTLRSAGAWDHSIFAAAVFAGAHATTRMHFGLGKEEAESVGVHVHTQRIEDHWARAWRDFSGEWPAEEDRTSFRSSLWNAGKAGGFSVSDTVAAAVTAGACQSTDLAPGLCVFGSALGAAAALSLRGSL